MGGRPWGERSRRPGAGEVVIVSLVPRGPPPPPSLSSPGLQDERLRRLEAALTEGRAREDALVEAWVRRTGRMPSAKVRRKWEKKWRREAKRAARRAEREARRARSRSPVRGGVYATVAVTCVLMALAQPRRLWWLVFVALGFFLLAARHLERPRRGAALEGESPRKGEAARGPWGLTYRTQSLREGEEARSPRGPPPEAESRRAGEGAPGAGGPPPEAEPRRVDARAAREVETEMYARLERPARSGAEASAERGGAGALPEVRALLREAVRAGAGARRTGESGAGPVTGAAVDPRGARVDALCGKLLAELREGPAVLREVVHAPERTVEALRRGCHELARRERQLRALATPEEARRLESEREALAARVSSERDAVVRERLTGALEALDAQRRQRAELATAADRLEAEHTRLYYTLEGLYAQVLRVRSADTLGEDVAGAGLRHSVEQLSAEVDAVTQALEEVHRAPDGRTRTR